MEAKFDATTFLGVKHMYSINKEKQNYYRQQINDKFKGLSPDVILLEGFEYGLPIDCKVVLSSIFTPDKIIDESDVAIKHGFLNKISLVPGDNQIIDEIDVTNFFGGNVAKVRSIQKDMQFIDALHSYYQALEQSRENPLEFALARYNYRDFKPQIFKDYYKKINGRDLPSDPNLIYKDFTPSERLSEKERRGSNRITDMQADLRNRSLLRAIQISKSIYQKPLVLFGSGHLTYLGPSLEKNFNKVDVKFESACGN